MVWRVRLFDGPSLQRMDGDEETVRFRSSRVQALLAYLALRLGRRCAREAISDALWPDEPDEAVLANRLRVTLSSLRRQMELPGTPFGSVIDVSVPGFVRLRPEAVWCDVAAFEAALAEGEPGRAASLARGPLLPGLHDEWLRPEQIRLDLAREALPSPLPEREVEPGLPTKSRHRLPLYLTKFIGRAEERRRLNWSLSDRRLVTITGPGGIGKTRLAVEVAREFDGASFHVALDEASQLPLVEAILGALGLASRQDESFESLVAALRLRPGSLLLLDGAETNVDGVAEVAMRLLAEVSDLRVLVTSRQRLELPGEWVLPLNPLPVPADEASLEAVARVPSVALFLDRARNVLPDFALREGNVEAIASVCRRLEGIPLAVELAAARVTLQSPAKLAAAVNEGMIGLSSRGRSHSERHRSLRAAIESSIDALSPDLIPFFARLSTFRGGWTAEAAVAVGGDPNAEDRIEDLLVRSLITVQEDEAGLRYGLLGPIREAAAERLSPSDASACRQRHADHFLHLASQIDEDDVRTFAPLDAEAENLELAFETGGTELWEGRAGALIHAFVRGRHRQAIRWIESSASGLDGVPDPETRFRWRYGACLVLPDVGRFEETESLARAMRDDATREAHAVYSDVVMGYVSAVRGINDRAVATLDAALSKARQLEDRPLLEACLSHLSGTLHGLPDLKAWARAEALARELRARLSGRSRRAALAPLLVAAALLPQRRLGEAYEFLKEAQTTAVRLGTRTELMYAFLYESSVAREQGSAAHAALLFGAFGALREAMGYSLERAQASRPSWIEELQADLARELGEAELASLAAEGRQAEPAALAARRVPRND